MIDYILSSTTKGQIFLGQLIVLGVYVLPWVVYLTLTVIKPADRSCNRILLVYFWWTIVLLLTTISIVYMQSDHLPRFLEMRSIILETQECGHRLVELRCHTTHIPELEKECFALAMCVTRTLDDLYMKAFNLSLWELLTNSWFAFPQFTLLVASIIATVIEF